LAHRDARDWYVFEAASWALAERRMPAARRRELWLEPLPAAELASTLRKFPLFASVSVDELFRMAAAARQVRHEAGTVLLKEGVVPELIHLVLDGGVTLASRDSAPRTVDAPAALGFVEALQGQAVRETARTSEVAVTLALTVEELRTLLADNTHLVSGLFATLADHVSAPDTAQVQSIGAEAELEQLAAKGLTPIEKTLALQRVPMFSQASAEEMRHLADATLTVPVIAGSELFPQSAPPALWVLLSGEVSVESAGGASPIVARGGDLVGALSAMSGKQFGRAAVGVRNGTALRIDRESLLDLLGARPELLRQVFAGIFKSQTSDAWSAQLLGDVGATSG
jgi:CRP-like cAMP-binding protein